MQKGLFAIIFITFCFTAFSQKINLVQIEGKVTTTKGIPLSFAHILIKNKEMGTISDYKGRFSFVTEAGDTIVFSSVGYKTVRYITKKNTKENIIKLHQIMTKDTIMLDEAIVLPWQDYEEFKEDFLAMDYVNDDKERAFFNIAMMERQLMINEERGMLPPTPGSAHRNFMQTEVYDKMYYAGQTPPLRIFNIAAWAEFFEALKNGGFKNPYKKYRK